MAELLEKNKLVNELNKLSNKWSISDKFLNCKYEFKNFNEALSFMNKVGVKCEEMDHHPKWTNVYNRLEIELFTHDKDGLTMKDFDLAIFMDQEFCIPRKIIHSEYSCQGLIKPRGDPSFASFAISTGDRGQLTVKSS